MNEMNTPKTATQTAVILAAGKGTRMLPLTLETPKPMLMSGGKNLIEWKLELLPESVNEVVIVVGYLGDKIREYFGDEWRGKKMRYATQEVQDGTGGALWAAKELLPERFLVMMGDDLYGKDDVTHMLSCDFAIGGYKIKDGEATGGLITKDAEGNFNSILEGTHQVDEGYISTNLFMLRNELFNYAPVQIPGRSEFGLPHTLLAVAKDRKVPLVEVKEWFQITAPEDLLRAEKEFLS